MGQAADDMYDLEMDWKDHGKWCAKHKMRYLDMSSGICPACEDGDPAAPTEIDWDVHEDEMDNYHAGVFDPDRG